MSNNPVKPFSKKLINDSTPFAIKEAFNHLRSNIMYTAKESNENPVYAVTSSDAGVGKSTIIANVALSFAQLGKKVLLVDADMRRPTQYKMFGYSKKNIGLSELLSKIETDDSAVIGSPVPNLFLLTSGCIPPNPSELISNQVFRNYVQKWREEYDIVFIDLPPVSVVSDPLSVAQIIDGFLIVAMAHKSNANRINAAIAALESVNGRIIGTIVNGTNPKGRRYGRYGKYSYGYYYTTDNS